MTQPQAGYTPLAATQFAQSLPPPSAGPPAQQGISYPTPTQPTTPQTPALAPMPGQAARFQPTEQSVESTGKQGPFTASAAQSALEAMGAHRELAAAQLEASGAQAAAQRAVEAGTQGTDEAQAIARRLRYQQLHGDVVEYERKRQSLMQEAQDSRIDPGKWFEDMPTGTKVLTTLGLMIAGFGHGYTGRGIDPAQWVNSRIQETVQAQRANLENKRQSIGALDSAYALQRQRWGDDETAALATEAAARQSIVSHLQRQAADETQPVMSRLMAAQVSSQLADDNQKLWEHIDDRTSETLQKKHSEKYVAATAPGLGVKINVNGKEQTISQAQYKGLEELGLVPATSPATRKTLAEAGKTEAEATKLAGTAAASPELKALTDVGTKLQSTNWERVQRNIQGTESQGALLDQQDWNARLISLYHATHPGIRVTPEMVQLGIGSYLVNPTDSTGTIEHKVRNALDFLGQKSPAGALPPGAEGGDAASP